MDRKPKGPFRAGIAEPNLKMRPVSLLLLAMLCPLGGIWMSNTARSGEADTENPSNKATPASNSKSNPGSSNNQSIVDQFRKSSEGQASLDKKLPSRDNIPSIEDEKNNPVPKDWTRLIVGKFRANSEYWPLIKTMEGVEVVIGRPSEIQKCRLDVYSRNRKVAVLWIYDISNTGKPISLGPKDSQSVVVGFDADGNVLYCACIPNLVP